MRRSDLPIAEPCCVSWDTMEGEGHKRFCSDCEKEVVNLSALTEEESRTFLETTPHPCIRYTYDQDGLVYFVHPQVKRQREGLKKLLAAAFAIPVALSLGACDLNHSPEEAAEAQAPEVVVADVDTYGIAEVESVDVEAEVSPIVDDSGAARLDIDMEDNSKVLDDELRNAFKKYRREPMEIMGLF